MELEPQYPRRPIDILVSFNAGTELRDVRPTVSTARTPFGPHYCLDSCWGSISCDMSVLLLAVLPNASASRRKRRYCEPAKYPQSFC
jgi:hypothetical protein